METPLKEIRLKRHQTQQQVALAVGMNQGNYSRLENGEASTSIEYAKRLAKHFGDAITVLEILDPTAYLQEKVS